MKIRRFPTNPIITPEMDDRIGSNINGPSLIRVPDWLPNKLGQYYLYFAHHQGQYIRLAYADDLAGPWTVYRPGTLTLAETPCYHHIASPDVHIDEANRRLIMYYHGPFVRPEDQADDPLTRQYPILGGQRTLVAISTDGLTFTSGNEAFGPSYFRVFRWRDYVYALGMPGMFFRSRDGLTGFENGPMLFNPDMRHAALLLRGDTLTVFYTQAYHCPEHIIASQITLTDDWQTWHPSDPQSVLLPATEYEGVDLSLAPSERGAIHERAHQVRDPGIFVEEGRVYLLYSVAGESGIAIAELMTII